MSSVNSISSGSFPIISPPASTGSAGTFPATGNQASGVQTQGAGEPAAPSQLQKAIDRMNQHLAGSDQSVRIGYVSQLHRLTVEVVDKSTGQVVGQFPSKSVIDGEIAMDKYIGMMLNKEG